MMDPAAEVRSVLRQMREIVGANPRFDALSDRMETLVMQNIVPTMSDKWRAYNLTPREEAILEVLDRASPRAVSDDAMMDAIYFDNPSPPQTDIIKVFICKIRRKLPSQHKITRLRGQGFRLVSSALPE